MTFTKKIPMTYANFFPLFYKYWDMVSKRGTEHTTLAVEILTSHVFMLLKIEWVKNKSKSDELKHICYALDAKFEDLSPNNFTGKDFIYLDHEKTWFYLQEHDDWKIVKLL